MISFAKGKSSLFWSAGVKGKGMPPEAASRVGCSGLIRLNWSTFAWINAIHHYVRRHLVCVPDASLHDRRQTESLCNEFPNNVLIGFRRFQELHSFIDRDRQALHDCADRIDFSSKRPSFRSAIAIFSTSLHMVVTPCGRYWLVRTYNASLHDQQ